MQPLLSILIATRNREQYCIRTIETILEIPDERIELCVQDNSDSDVLQEYIRERPGDERLKYNYTAPPFSSIDNFNAAINLSTGKYLCLIGDDDGVCRQLLDVVEWADDNLVESVCPVVYSEYVWPSTYGDERDAALVIPETGGRSELKNPAAIVSGFFRDGALDYLKKGFPKLYHGVIKRTCLEKIRSKTGYYLGGLSPDIYAAVALSCVVKSHLLIDLPLTIAGTCRASTTFASATGEHSGELRLAPHFRNRDNYEWDKLVPAVYSVETIWAESALKAAADMNRADLRENFAESKFMAKNILRNTSKLGYFSRQTWLHLVRNRKIHLAPAITGIIGIQLLRFASIKMIGLIRRKITSNGISFRNVQDIREATVFATGNLDGRNVIPFCK